MRLLHASLIFIGILLLCPLLNGQSLKTNSSADSIKTDSLKRVTADSLKWNSLVQSIVNLKTQMTPKGDSALRIGQFTLFKTSKVPMYKVEKQPKTEEVLKNKACDCSNGDNDCDCKTKTGKTASIKKVSFLLKEGTIIDLQVFTTDNKTFSNDGKPIEISKFNERCDLLKAYNGTEYEYIQTCDILQWERQSTQLPNNAYFILDSIRPERTLYRETGATTILDLRVASDMLGAFQNVPNALFQGDVSLTQIMNSNNVKNKGLFYFNYLKFHFNLSKFDTRYRITPIDNNFYRMTLFQRTWLTGDVAINVLKAWITRKSESSFFINLGGGFGLSEITPSSGVQTTTVMPFVFGETGLEGRFASNFSYDLNARVINHTAPQLENPKLSSSRLIIKPHMTVYWYPLASQQTSMFMRLGYNQDLTDKKLFVQVQFGYSMLLGDNVRKN